MTPTSARPQDPGSDFAPGDPPMFTTTSKAYGNGVYQGVLEGEAVDAFLRQSEVYDVVRKRWTFPDGTKGLLHGVYDILRSIVRRFVVSSVPGVERTVMSSENTPGCDAKNADGYRVCPMLVVRAAGPSFEIPTFNGEPSGDPSTAVGFCNMASYFVVRSESELGSEEGMLEEMESYARRIFREQPNRIYVRSLFITERRAWMVHMDRSGGQITPPIDIHGDARTFVRIVAGLSSTNERLLGLDDSIQWTIVNCRKAEGTLTTTGPSGEPKAFKIIELLVGARDSIVGRATTCWKVQDPESFEEYVVKDSWQPDVVEPEHNLLELVKGVPGVVQMVAHETGRAQLKDFRCPTTSGRYLNRISRRTTMEAYGKPIVHFTSPLLVLCALRDAIAGHQRLCGDGLRILHRDISHQNILLGREGAPVGQRGILIDLELAFQATDAEPTVPTNSNIGTQLFQSISVLASARLAEKTLSHDHIDELESFFYLLAYIVLVYEPDGTQLPDESDGVTMVCGWGAEETEEAEMNKRQFMRSFPKLTKLVRTTWGPVCGTLFQSFFRWILERTADKKAIFGGFKCKPYLLGGSSPFDVFYSLRDEHFATVLKMFDQAIDEITATSTDKDVAEPATAPSNPPVVRHSQPPQHSRTQVQNGAKPGILTLPTEIAAANPSVGAEAPKPPTRVGAASSVPPAPPAVPAPLRRSTRIQENRLQTSPVSLDPAVNDLPRTVKSKASTPSLPAATEPRRSTRIQKRRLEEEENIDVSKPKLRRTKNGPRRATRSR